MSASSVFRIITNATLLATLLRPPDKIHFSEQNYCGLVFEDAPVNTTVIRVKATHSEGKAFMYSIIRGNERGLFSVDVIRGEISIAAPLDHELVSKHTLVISADSTEGQTRQTTTTVHIRVADINDNAPIFQVTDHRVEVVEENYLGVPHDLGRVWARDRDWIDKKNLLYTLIGDGVDGFSPEDAFFAIHPRSGVVTQLKPLDRDPPNGKAVWKLRVKVHDGQSEWATTRIDAFKHHLVGSFSSHTTEGGHESDDEVTNKEIQKRKRSIFPQSGEATETDERCRFDDHESFKVTSTTPRDNEAQKINEKLSTKKKNQLIRRGTKKTLEKENRVRRTIINSPGSMMPIHKSVASESENCDLFGSLTSPLNQEQQARLKHSVYKLKSSRDYHRKPNFHVVETGLTIIVKDINDNPPIFPNTTIYAEVQENGPRDLHVAMVTAWDADDPHSPTNAVVRYYLEKNAVDDRNMSPIFKINASTGEIKTAHCCLDREASYQYQLRVVAVDGVGLRGTGTVVVLLTDVNDNSPRFARREWKFVINETQGTTVPDNATLFEISVNDFDTSNKFLFRVVESSGWGWEFFGIRASGPVGEVSALKPLDYEDKQQRRGIRFLVQVTDKGSWPDYPDSRVESAWVEVRLRDVNDNPPVFQRRFIHVTLKEDAPPGTFVENVTVIDPDQDGENSVALKLMDDYADLEINDCGEIRTTIPLDRESPKGPTGIVRILAVDHGIPRLSSTATIVVKVTDVNDCAPRILGPTVFHVKENSEPKRIGIILATDDDDWGLSHGPPFTFSLADSNPSYLSKLLEFRFLKGLDSGRGGAELFTKVPLDREKYRQIVVKVTIHDAANVASVNNIIVNVDDVNDNDMKPAHKTIYIWKTKNARGNYTIGNVFVEDPDDADGKDKRFTWAEEHSSKLFSLEESSGEIQVSSRIPQGRYQMRFKVSDFFRRQANVHANVTVHVKVIDENTLSHALAITLFPVTPSALIKDWVPNTTSGGLGNLTSTLKNILPYVQLDIISVSKGRRPAPKFVPNAWSSSFFYYEETTTTAALENDVINPSTTVWITALDSERKFLETYMLRGLLEMKIKEIESAMSLNVDFEDEEIEMLPDHRFSLSKLSDFKPRIVLPVWSSFPAMSFIPEDDFSVNSQISQTEFKKQDSFSLQVVDANATALVTPMIRRVLFCSSKEFQTPNKGQMPHCEAPTCLNGGRYVPTSWGSKCICPGGTQGRWCKLTSMNIFPGGFSWIEPLPPCFPLTVSIQFATSHPHGILLYSGPLSERVSSNSFLEPNGNRKTVSSPLFVLQLSQGRLQVLIEGFFGGHKLEISPSPSFSDGRWHHVYMLLDHKGASVMSDFCAKGENRTGAINNCYANTRWRRKSHASKYTWKVPWQVSLPLQVGGLAQAPPKGQAHGWTNEIVDNSFEGCIDHLRVNEKLMDMGRAFLRKGIQTGRCRLHETLCSASCSPRGTCLNEEDRYLCSCPAGFQGATCENRTSSAIFYSNRVKKISLDFDTNPYETRLQLRFKTHAKNISILRLRSRNDTFLNLRVQEGYLCLIYEQQWLEDSKQFPFEMLKHNFSIPSVYEKEIPSHTIQLKIKEMNTQMNINQPHQNNLDNSRSKDDLRVCLDIVCSDGLWHDVRGGKFGQSLLLEVDDGDEGERNFSLQHNHHPVEFVLQRSEGVILGNDSTEDGSKICIDDLRLFGRPISLSNRKSSSSSKKFVNNRTTSCTFSDVCEHDKCDSFTNTCKRLFRCPPGQTPTTNGCQAYDLCFYQPCLHGGSCSKSANGDPFCTCLPTFSGDFCQWQSRHGSGHEFDIPLVAVVATLFFFILAMAAGLVWWCARRKRRNRHLRSRNLSSGGPEAVENSEDSNISESLRKATRVNNFSPDDLRAYAYEGDGSSSVSLESALAEKSSKEHNRSCQNEITLKNCEQRKMYSPKKERCFRIDHFALRDECEESTEILPLTPTIKDAVDLLNDHLDTSFP